MTASDRVLEERLSAAAPAPGPPPDVAALWRRAGRARQQRTTAAALGTAAVVGLGTVTAAVALRPQVELAPGAGGGDLQHSPTPTVDPDVAYCDAADPVLGDILRARSGTPASEEPTSGEWTPADYEQSHATMTQQFATAHAASPAELSEHWEALEADLAAQVEVWESIDWDPHSIGWEALREQMGALPTASAGSLGMETVLDDFETRCPVD